MEKYVQLTSDSVTFLLTNTFASDVVNDKESTKKIVNVKLSKVINREIMHKKRTDATGGD